MSEAIHPVSGPEAKQPAEQQVEAEARREARSDHTELSMTPIAMIGGVNYIDGGGYMEYWGCIDGPDDMHRRERIGGIADVRSI